jgi:hypothetical protein
MRKRRSRCAPVVESLEDRVVLSVIHHSSAAATVLAARDSTGVGTGHPEIDRLQHATRTHGSASHAVPGLGGTTLITNFEQGFVFDSPGTLVSITGHFDPSAFTVVIFTTKTGREYTAVPPVVTVSSVVVATPLFIHPTTLTIGAGGDHVVIEQQILGGVDRTRAIYHLQSQQLPKSDLPAATVMTSVLVLAQSEMATDIANYQTLSAAGVDPTADAASLAQLQAMQQETTGLEGRIVSPEQGMTSPIPLGTLQGADAAIDEASLAMMARLLQASLAGGGMSLPTTSATPAAKTLSAESTSPGHPYPASSGPTISSLAPWAILAEAIIQPLDKAELSVVKLTGPEAARAAAIGSEVEFLTAVLDIEAYAGYEYYESGQFIQAWNDITSHVSNPTSGLATSVSEGDQQLQAATQSMTGAEDLFQRFRGVTPQGQTLENDGDADAQAIEAAPQQAVAIDQQIINLESV